ncbi:MAG: preprotein translocase subunit SecE [Verrucomicrobiales bacterium]|jgi:preprotein translocase subunit SecE|nr:preprotein translocase subunit SecE [Verrucomicrobiales bacterium]
MDILKSILAWFLASWFITLPVLAAIIVLFLARKPIARFYGEVRGELMKCTWPWDSEQTGFRKYRVLIDSTLVVCVASLLLAGYTTGFDFVISNLVTGLTGLVTGSF